MPVFPVSCVKMQQITLTAPDDWHIHLRDGDGLQAIVQHAASQFRRAIVMPNLVPPVTTVAQAHAYRERLLSWIPDSDFQALMTLYLTDNTPVEEIHRAAESPHVFAVKLYPAGATTNADSGVTDIRLVRKTLGAMAECGLPLLVHGEVTDPQVDMFDREIVFIDTILSPLIRQFPTLKVVLEHVTTRDGIDFIRNANENIAGTLTAHHLLLNRNAIFQGGIRPHHYCLPVLKREDHRKVLLEAATSGSSQFFLGSDSAPHPRSKKESACGCAGIYTAHAAIELYAEVFDSVGRLDKLEQFAAFNGPDFYGLPRNTETITLVKQAWSVPENYPFGNEIVIPFRANESVAWQRR